MAVSDLLQAGAGAIFGSIVGPYVTSARDRRGLRADVSRALAAVEDARGGGGVDFKSFIALTRTLQGHALVAGLPREPVDDYVFLATVARRASDQGWEYNPDPDSEGSIPGELDTLIRDAADIVLRHVWSPVLARLRNRSKVLRADQAQVMNMLLAEQKHDEKNRTWTVDWATAWRRR